QVAAEEPGRFFEIGPPGEPSHLDELLVGKERVLRAQDELSELFHKPGELRLLLERRPMLLLGRVVEHLADERELLGTGEKPQLYCYSRALSSLSNSDAVDTNRLL